MPSPVLELAARLGVRRPGLVAEIARACGISTSAVSQWQRVPVERAGAVARVLGVKRWRVRPDVWSRPRRGQAAE